MVQRINALPEQLKRKGRFAGASGLGGRDVACNVFDRQNVTER
jgi:hypothetical protein